SGIKFILLGESFPQNRYVYDLDTAYNSGGLRFNLMKEFEIADEKYLIEFLENKQTVIADCAYCPLCYLEKPSQKRHAATHCLKSYKLDFLRSNEAKIITFFPRNSGFLKRELPEIQNRVIKDCKFSNLKGLKDLIK
ncbi:hypothetical protein ACFLTA_08640, partial [Bacteroidota bacterium]